MKITKKMMIKFRAFSLTIYEPFLGIPYRKIAV